ncbi:MAG: VWA domain-containing protein [Vicinamibacterales bacterium]
MGRLSLVLGVAIQLIAQSPTVQNQTPQQPTFKSGVELVTIDATVVDKDGHPVKGLRPDDFIVTLQGQQRPVRLLDFLEFGGGAASEAPAGADATNRPQAHIQQTRGGRVVVIVFDDLSFKPGPGKTLLAAAERTLSSFGPDDLIGIVTTSGLGPAVNPTRDRAPIIAALHDKKMIGRYDDSAAPFEVTEQEGLDIRRDFPQQTFLSVLVRECGTPDTTSQCAGQLRAAADAFGDMTLRRMAQQLATYREIIHALSAAPDAPRVIIALTAGIALGLDTSEYADSLEQLSRTAADTKVQFYALSELPDLVDFSSHLQAPTLLAAGKFMNAGAQVVANAAGGEAFLVAGTADRFIKRIESETSGFYRLGVEPPANAGGQRYLKTTVRVRESGLTIRTTRASIMPTVAAAPVDIDHELRTRLAEGGTSYGVPLTIGAEMRRDPTDVTRIEMDVSVDIPPSVKAPLTMMYGLMDETGKIIDAGRTQAAQAAPSGYRLAFPIRASAGQYRLRVAASDANGAIGSVEKPVAATLARIGGYSVSDILTAITGADGAPRLVALEAIPRDTQTLTVSLELYAETAAAGPVQVRFDLIQPGGEPIATSTLAPAVSGTAHIAVAHLAIGHLSPGAYTIRATVVDDGADVGAQSATFTKPGS